MQASLPPSNTIGGSSARKKMLELKEKFRWNCPSASPSTSPTMINSALSGMESPIFLFD